LRVQREQLACGLGGMTWMRFLLGYTFAKNPQGQKLALWPQLTAGRL
jgi:hypothetical protein